MPPVAPAQGRGQLGSGCSPLPQGSPSCPCWFFRVFVGAADGDAPAWAAARFGRCLASLLAQPRGAGGGARGRVGPRGAAPTVWGMGLGSLIASADQAGRSGPVPGMRLREPPSRLALIAASPSLAARRWQPVALSADLPRLSERPVPAHNGPLCCAADPGGRRQGTAGPALAWPLPWPTCRLGPPWHSRSMWGRSRVRRWHRGVGGVELSAGTSRAAAGQPHGCWASRLSGPVPPISGRRGSPGSGAGTNPAWCPGQPRVLLAQAGSRLPSAGLAQAVPSCLSGRG